MNDQNIAFIGTGVMGNSMARNLINAGYQLTVYTRTAAKAQDLIAQGAQWAQSPAEAARNADVVITIVGYPQDVEECYLGAQGVFSTLKPTALTIDMTTSSPALAQKIYAEGCRKNIHCLDAPVSGGDIGARSGKLSIMVGGDEDSFQRASPLFSAMGSNIVYQGQAGSGQHTKMCNQIVIASGMVGIAESMAYAKRSGLDPQQILKSIESGAAGSWALTNLVPRALDGDYSPGFFVKHFIKDMGIALQSAKEMKLDLPGLDLAEKLYQELAHAGGENDGTHAIIRHYFDKISASS